MFPPPPEKSAASSASRSRPDTDLCVRPHGPAPGPHHDRVPLLSVLPARRTLTGALLGLLLAVTLTTVILGQVEDAAATQRERCQQHREDSLRAARAATGGTSGPETVVIGDSWSVGLGLHDPAQAWPSRLPGRVSVAGFSGSGFSAAASHCGPVSYAVRAARAVAPGTAVVVVEGGLNDVDQPPAAVALGFTRLVRLLEEREVGRTVVVGPAPAPLRAASVPRVDRLLAGLAAAAGVEYVSAADWQVDYLPDRLHPDVDGHRAFGDAVTAVLAPAKE